VVHFIEDSYAVARALSITNRNLFTHVSEVLKKVVFSDLNMKSTPQRDVTKTIKSYFNHYEAIEREDKISQEIDDLLWASYNLKKANPKKQSQQEVDESIINYKKTYNEHPLAIFAFDPKDISDLTMQAIERRYRERAKLFHPDSVVNVNKDSKKFIQLQEALNLAKNVLPKLKETYIDANSANNKYSFKL
jgi:DnaJ-domain-containing protein 1